jgi:prepilin-type N-terminal cleavage/methylation domain-containing protein/prepilin-type processing-associated H-X9-DG protein
MKNRRGFTLVELLVVIGIIAVLISILLPALGRARESANNAKCLSNLRTLATAYRMYAQQYKDAVPIGYINGVKQANYFTWVEGSEPPSRPGGYALLGRIYRANLLTKPWDGVSPRNTEGGGGRVFFCPSDTNESFSFNGVFNQWPPGSNWNAANPDSSRSGYFVRPDRSWSGVTVWEPVGGYPKMFKLKNRALITDGANRPDSLRMRHKAGVNVAFTDASVALVPAKAIAPTLSRITPGPNDTVNNPLIDKLWEVFDKR